MRLILPLFTVATLLFSSCSDANEDVANQAKNNNTIDSSQIDSETLPPAYFLSVEKWDSLSGEQKNYYVVNFAGIESEAAAIDLVDSLLPTFPKSGYLWIPDFASLSGKEMFAVFIDQGTYGPSLIKNTVQPFKNEIKGIYVVGVNQNTDRWVAYSPLDIRINGEKQKQIFIYAKPEDEQEYGESGGEDWGWFVNDVSEYFSKHHPEILVTNFYSNGLLPEEISKFEKSLDLEGFGYILMDGKKTDFVGHGFPEDVIADACDFFDLEMVESE